MDLLRIDYFVKLRIFRNNSIYLFFLKRGVFFLEKLKKYLPHIIVIAFILMYLLLFVKHTFASDLDNGLPDLPTEIYGHDYVLVSSHSNSKDTITFYLLIFDDVSSVTSDTLQSDISSGTSSFTLQGMNGVRYWYQYSFEDGWEKSNRQTTTFSLNPINLKIWQSTFDIPYTHDTSITAIYSNCNIIYKYGISDVVVGYERDISVDDDTVITVYPSSLHVELPFFCILKNDAGKYYVLYSSDVCTATPTPYANTNDSINFSGCLYDIESGTCDHTRNSTSFSPLFSNHNILYDDGSLFFCKTSEESLAVLQGGMTTRTIVTTTFQAVFGMIPLMIILAVGLVGFRKAWMFLKQNLSTS